MTIFLINWLILLRYSLGIKYIFALFLIMVLSDELLLFSFLCPKIDALKIKCKPLLAQMVKWLWHAIPTEFPHYVVTWELQKACRWLANVLAKKETDGLSLVELYKFSDLLTMSIPSCLSDLTTYNGLLDLRPYTIRKISVKSNTNIQFCQSMFGKNTRIAPIAGQVFCRKTF